MSDMWLVSVTTQSDSESPGEKPTVFLTADHIGFRMAQDRPLKVQSVRLQLTLASYENAFSQFRFRKMQKCAI